MQAWLVLEDGSVWQGEQRGAFKETVCEIAFTTSMTAYVEALTDPANTGLGIMFTYPLIGNYGVQPEDFESAKLRPACIIVNELCQQPSNFRCSGTLEDLLRSQGIPCLAAVDTRALTQKLRDGGAMRGVLTDDISNLDAKISMARQAVMSSLIKNVSVEEKIERGLQNNGTKVALLDCGVKNSVIFSLLERGCQLTQYPCDTNADEILSAGHSAAVIAGGPGDPNSYSDLIANVRNLYLSGIPLLGLELGHQLIALAAGATVERMSHSHRGANYPVKFGAQDKTYMTAQNHGFTVASNKLPDSSELLCFNVNDNTVEGLFYKNRPCFSLQFQPANETAFLLDEFLKMAENTKNPWD